MARSNNSSATPAVDHEDAARPISADTRKSAEKRKRGPKRVFPTCSFEDALEFAQAIYRIGSGQSVRRLTLFNELQKSPDSSVSRQLIADVNKYGLIKGNHSSEFLELTPNGYLAAGDDVSPRDRAQAQATLAVLNIPAFKTLYERYANNRLPSQSVLADELKQQGIHEELVTEAIETFIVNAKFVGLLKTLSGAERLITIEHLLEEIPSTGGSHAAILVAPTSDGSRPEASKPYLDQVCFYITPIGDENTEVRYHSDLFLNSLVEPTLEQFGLKVVRADQIDKPGTITRQVIEYLLQSKLVIADLSFHNPNVFYELAIRHFARLPTVQIIRASDPIPFDLNQIRTIPIDCSSIYALVPKLDTYRVQIASQVRRALEDPDNVDNPITSYAPHFKVQAAEQPT